MSIYKDVFKLTPGSCITIAKNSLDIGRKKYWSLSEVAENGLLNPIKDSEEAIYSVEEALKKSINLQSVSDVPLGAFLSGGIDSTLISTLMQHNSQTPIRTFSVGFEEDGFDESYHAGVVANLLGTEHNKIIVNSKDALEIIPKLPELYDEPFADSSQIPTFLISQVARQHVKVVLSGDAGDELFGGYNRYIWAPFFWSKVSLFPQVIRDSVANILDAIPSRLWNSILSGHVAHPNDKIQKLILILKTSSNIDDVYQSLISIWSLYDSPNRCNNQYDINIHPPSCIKDPKLRMMYADSRGYLPDDILTKVDRASMGVSLETRVPFLDYQLVELSWRIPLDYKIRNNKGKWILRQIIDKYIPYGMHNKPKTGFSIPLGAWLRGPLKDWSNDLLNSYISNSDEHSRNKKIQAMWAAHLGQKHDFSRQLWVVLMFESWRNGKDVK
jgi:asparagine synthase (glutamine-hydrolysing)